ncbi:replicative DNA helicase [Actinomarinicola tropica]|uniref:Replicative DNA helicase n=1 Tax=Actinomarinicola tropica TaxID=2789776 RepID=A0A5Q2RJB4_9ACTN|nr:replicative DNA helicase [Actinomarinicola tropica]QGG96869.1 replicative DNA helicase [Actinomarinicola tropica]
MALPADELSPRRSGARTPPHNLEVEESLLGAMLLSRDAISDAAEVGIEAGDFYKPSHGHVYDAITSLYAAGEPVDPVTVSAELQRADLLDAIGGSARLVALQSATPAISNATRYARIIEEHALLRRLIGVAGEIAELGYDIPDDVTKAVDTAEQLVFDVAQRRTTDSMSAIRDLLADNLDRLEALYERGESITGVPTGYHDLDELLSGLQPNALYVVGARPAMGKALALDTPIPTPTGWTTMGELREGDLVLDERGGSARVTYRSPIHLERDCYEVELDDGARIVADAEHQWCVRDAATGETRVATTAQLVEGGVRHAGRPRWSIPLAQPLDLAAHDLPADPYVLGSWIAGACGVSSALDIDGDDPAHFRAEHEAAGYVSGGRLLARELQQLGLLGGVPPLIPDRYLRGAAKHRQSLLEGLMDTEGTILDGGAVELVLADPTVAGQVRELVCSLGGRPDPVEHRTIATPDGDARFDAWALRWLPRDPVFRLPRKAARWSPAPGLPSARAIVGLHPVDSVPVSCITVDSPSHLYLAGESLVPTHNTSFALGMAAHAALESHRPVLFFSLEMSRLELTQRIVCAEARVDSQRVRNGKLVEADWNKIAHATGRLAEAPLWIDDNPALTVMEIRSKARRLKSKVGDLGMIVIDYLQLMTGRGNAENRQVEVSEMSRGLKILARELEVPVVALSQLSRGLEMRADKRPVLADLRESGSIEQDADVVMFIYRDEVYNPDSADRGTAEIIVSKHRNGPTGVSRLAFLDHYARYANMAKGV